MINSDQAKEIAVYLRELDSALHNDDDSLLHTSINLTTLANAIDANETVMSGIDIMRRVRAGTG
jgi:hypothetical protein